MGLIRNCVHPPVTISLQQPTSQLPGRSFCFSYFLSVLFLRLVPLFTLLLLLIFRKEILLLLYSL